MRHHHIYPCSGIQGRAYIVYNMTLRLSLTFSSQIKNIDISNKGLVNSKRGVEAANNDISGVSSPFSILKDLGGKQGGEEALSSGTLHSFIVWPVFLHLQQICAFLPWGK